MSLCLLLCLTHICMCIHVNLIQKPRELTFIDLSLLFFTRLVVFVWISEVSNSVVLSVIIRGALCDDCLCTYHHHISFWIGLPFNSPTYLESRCIVSCVQGACSGLSVKKLRANSHCQDFKKYGIVRYSLMKVWTSWTSWIQGIYIRYENRLCLAR
jgi:hypothetical protein